VLIAERNAKFPLSLTQTDLFTAENAGLREETREEDTKLSRKSSSFHKPQFSVSLVFSM